MDCISPDRLQNELEAEDNVAHKDRNYKLKLFHEIYAHFHIVLYNIWYCTDPDCNNFAATKAQK